jgi:DNA-directed RNA polymerase subunit RPC12/RpoP
MPIKEIKCPNCGKKSEVSEYQENRYRCLRCDALLRYEPETEQMVSEYKPCPKCGGNMIVEERRSRASLYASIFFLLLMLIFWGGCILLEAKESGFALGGVGGFISFILFFGFILHYFTEAPHHNYHRCIECGLLIQKQ